MQREPSIFSKISNATDVSVIFIIGLLFSFKNGIIIYGISCIANNTIPNIQNPKY